MASPMDPPSTGRRLPPNSGHPPSTTITPTSPGASGNTTPGAVVPLTPTIEGGVATPRTFPVPAGGSSGPVGIANSNWHGKLISVAPNPRFRAKGEAAFRGAESTLIRFRIVEGPPFVDNRPVVPPATVNLTPGLLEEVEVDRGGNDPFPTPTNRVRISVFGSRISYNVIPSPGGHERWPGWDRGRRLRLLSFPAQLIFHERTGDSSVRFFLSAGTASFAASPKTVDASRPPTQPHLLV